MLDEDIRFAFKNRMEQMIQQIAENPEDKDKIPLLEQLAEAVAPLALGMILWKVQNTYWGLLRKQGPAMKQRAEQEMLPPWNGSLNSQSSVNGSALASINCTSSQPFKWRLRRNVLAA